MDSNNLPPQTATEAEDATVHRKRSAPDAVEQQTTSTSAVTSTEAAQAADITPPDAKRHQETVAGGDETSPGDGAQASRQKPSSGEGGHVPCGDVPSDPEALKQALKKQIEYYFSDANMEHDEFFQKKIKSDPESWLSVDYIISSRNVKRLNVDSAGAIIAALDKSHLETKTDEHGKSWIRRNEPLPPLQTQRRTGNRNPKQQKLVDMTTLHDNGCFLKAVDCPEEASWEAIKTALAAKLPEGGRIRFVSHLNDGCCYIYALRFQGDKEFFSKTVELDISGAKVVASLITDATEATEFIKKLPSSIVSQRERNMTQNKRSTKNQKPTKGGEATPKRPIMLAGNTFDSMNHLRNCVKELLGKTEKGTTLKKGQPAFEVITAILKYHPNAEEKSRNMTDIKVDEVLKGNQTSKCFFVVREGGDSEDFSMIKCLAQLEANPPYKPQDAEETKEKNNAKENEGKENDLKENHAKENEEKENDLKENDAKENEGKENDAKENDAKENDAKENDAKENDAKENDAKENDAKENEGKETALVSADEGSAAAAAAETLA